MFLALIPTIWLAIAGFVVILCRSAAEGDAVLHSGAEHATAQAPFTVASDAHAHPRATWRSPDAPVLSRRAARKSAGQSRGSRAGR
jgi:hypothetical protein